jgi:cytoskeletal protein RodZ
MDPGTIMVLVLSLGVLALLVWFEINSRRNEASKKQTPRSAQPGVSGAGNKTRSKAESEIDKKAA